MAKKQREFFNDVYVARNKKEFERILDLLCNLNVHLRTTPSSYNIEYNRKD